MDKIAFSSVFKSFGEKTVLNGLTLNVRAGDVYGLLGPNGCGKSTAINILCNLLDHDRGEVLIDGAARGGDVKRILGVCPQEIALYRDLLPSENLAFYGRVYSVPSAELKTRVEELLQLLGLDAHRRTQVGNLSGGLQRRVNIAAALVHDPEILILDEPTAAVDIEARHELWGLVETLKARGITILLTTHHLDEAERLCTRVGIMREGRVILSGTVPELIENLGFKAVALVEASDGPALARRAADNGWPLRRYEGKDALLLPDLPTLPQLVGQLGDVGLTSATLRQAALDHVYFEAFRKSAEP